MSTTISAHNVLGSMRSDMRNQPAKPKSRRPKVFANGIAGERHVAEEEPGQGKRYQANGLYRKPP